MPHLKHRIEKLEKSKSSNKLSPAEAMEIARLMQGGALLPGKNPSHVNYRPSGNCAPKKTEEQEKRLDELIKKLAASSRAPKSV